MRIPRLVLAIAVVAVLSGATRGSAQLGSEHISSYQVDARIEQSGTVRVREVIDYDFGVVPRHGIFRDIPVRVDYPKKANTDRVYRLHVISVRASEGTPAQYTTGRADSNGVGYERIKIGDPNRTITGAHSYEITYTLQGVLNGFPEHDEMVLNAIGTQWSVPIDRAAVRVEAPATIQRVGCATGPFGSNLPCDSSTGNAAVATFSQSDLSPFSGVTVTVAIPKGVVPPPKPVLEERFSLARAFAVTPFTAGLGGALLLVVVAGFAFLQWRFGRDRRYVGSPVDEAFGTASGTDEPVPLLAHEETPVEFVPPDHLRPGELGTLVDFTANPLDVTATIVDLAVRGYLVIEELPHEGHHRPDWKLTQKKEPDAQLKDYERTLLTSLFATGHEVKLSSLRYKFASDMRRVQKALTDDAMSQGWFVRPPGATRFRWGAFAFLVFGLGVGLTIVLAVFTHAALLGIPLVVAGLLLFFGAFWMPQRTAKGSAVLRRAEGFRRFINESEKDRARFAEQKNLFSEYLPYAIVFGATHKWANAFAGLDDRPPDTSSWYVSSTVFSVATFSGAIDGFTVSTAGTLTSTPPSTSGASGFGGGGFSGGGAGGGGGGSW